MSSSRLTVKFSPAASDLLRLRICAVPFGAAFLLLARGWSGAVMFGVVQVGFALVAYRFFRQRLELDDRGVTIVHVWSSRRIEFANVLCVTGGTSMTFVGDGPSDGLPVNHESRYAVEDFLHDHAREIKVNPVEPWVDRHGRWHGELHRTDPLESIRSARKAALGRWTVEVVVLDEHRFQASAHTHAGPADARAGELRGTLREATDDAIAMIEEFAREQ